MTQRKEILLNTDWLTTALAVGGAVFLSVGIAYDSWRLFIGRWTPRIPSQGSLWESVMIGYTVLLCVYLAVVVRERNVRLAFALLSIELAFHLAAFSTPLQFSTRYLLEVTRVPVQLAAYILLLVYAIQWFRSKVVHV